MELTRFFLFSCVTRPERVSGVRQVGEGPHMTPCVTSAPLALLWGELSTTFEVGPSPLAARPAIAKKKKKRNGTTSLPGTATRWCVCANKWLRIISAEVADTAIRANCAAIDAVAPGVPSSVRTWTALPTRTQSGRPDPNARFEKPAAPPIRPHRPGRVATPLPPPSRPIRRRTVPRAHSRARAR